MANDYYENLDTEILQTRLRDLDNGLYEFGKALTTLPDVPCLSLLSLLIAPAMNAQGSDFGEIGKNLQKVVGLSLIPPNCELEHAAGLWKVIKDAVRMQQK